MSGLLRWLNAPASWCGLMAATGVLVLQALGLLGAWGVGAAAVGYGAGLAAGAWRWGWPSTRPPALPALQFEEGGDARESMGRALAGVRRLTQDNPGERIPAPLVQRIQRLCDRLESLLDHWERSRGQLSPQDSFHARHIAIRYLPQALNTYLSIPPQFATTQLLTNGKTAQVTFEVVLTDLESKVDQLAHDLASQDAQAFLRHSEFLTQKFGPKDIA